MVVSPLFLLIPLAGLAAAAFLVFILVRRRR